MIAVRMGTISPFFTTYTCEPHEKGKKMNWFLKGNGNELEKQGETLFQKTRKKSSRRKKVFIRNPHQ